MRVDTGALDASAPLSAAGALDRAAEAVARQIDAGVLLEPGGAARAEAYLGTLQAKLKLVVAGADPVPVRRWLSASRLCRPLIDALISELLSWPEDPASAPALLGALKACLATRPEAQAHKSRAADDGGAPSEDLAQSMRAPGAFDLLVEVAHDFRSPLASILFLAEALRDGHSGPVTDGQRSQLGLIYSAAFGLSSIASDVMDLAKRERSLVEDEPIPFSPAEVVRNVERMVKPIVEEKHLEFRVVVPDRWQSRGHPHALSRVLLNLTTNALKFTDEGGVEVGVRTLPHGGLEYYVQDTGRGISPEQQRELFRPFKRRSSKAEDGHHFSGGGIGLSMARRLVAAMGSDLTLDSSDRSGTRFSFVLHPSRTP